jgi:hypothetical protein
MAYSITFVPAMPRTFEIKECELAITMHLLTNWQQVSKRRWCLLKQTNIADNATNSDPYSTEQYDHLLFSISPTKSEKWDIIQNKLKLATRNVKQTVPMFVGLGIFKTTH